MPDACIFCLITEGRLHCEKLYESEHLMAFLDIAPAFPGHALIVPKVHSRDIFSMQQPVGEELLEAMRLVGAAVMAAAGAEGLNIIQNNGRAAWQQVDHVHWHLIPRRDGDGFEPWKQGTYESGKAMADMAERIRARLCRG